MGVLGEFSKNADSQSTKYDIVYPLLTSLFTSLAALRARYGHDRWAFSCRRCVESVTEQGSAGKGSLRLLREDTAIL